MAGPGGVSSSGAPRIGGAGQAAGGGADKADKGKDKGPDLAGKAAEAVTQLDSDTALADAGREAAAGVSTLSDTGEPGVLLRPKGSGWLGNPGEGNHPGGGTSHLRASLAMAGGDAASSGPDDVEMRPKGSGHVPGFPGDFVEGDGGSDEEARPKGSGTPIGLPFDFPGFPGNGPRVLRPKGSGNAPGIGDEMAIGGVNHPGLHLGSPMLAAFNGASPFGGDWISQVTSSSTLADILDGIREWALRPKGSGHAPSPGEGNGHGQGNGFANGHGTIPEGALAWWENELFGDNPILSSGELTTQGGVPENAA